MNTKELGFILRNGENYLIEFKERANASLAREMCAFANASGGTILLGVDDNSCITGLKLSNSLKSRIQDTASNCQPPLSIIMEVVEDIILIHIPEAEIKPVQCSDGFYPSGYGDS